MATRTKTIEFNFPTDTTSLTAGVRRDFSAISVYLPESSVTFRSVEVRLNVFDDIIAAANVTSWLIGIKLAAVAFDDVTVTDNISNSGEAQSYIFTRDVTSYFTTNWSGASMTCQIGCLFGNNNTINHSAKLLITYDYDDTSATHIKTIRVPIESTRSVLTTTYQTVGGATAIPDITGSYLPESSVNIRQISLELWGNDACNANTTFTSEVRINGGSDLTWYNQTSTMNSARWAYGILDITAVDLSSARSLEGRTVTITNRMDNVCGMVTVTYEFDPAASTTIYNSLILGAADTVAYLHGTTAADNDRWGRNIYIEEPATITLQASAACLFMNSAAGFNFLIRAGSQGYVTYTMTAGSLQCGQWSCSHRIDGGGSAGTAGITLARGSNSYVLDWYTNNANEGWNLSGFLILNYTSAKHSSGVGAHSHTIYKSLKDTTADARIQTLTSQTMIDIAESAYFINSATIYMPSITDNSTNISYCIDAERQAGEAEGDGWENIYVGTGLADSENQVSTVWGASRKAWKRWTGDPDANRMDLETARRVRIMVPHFAWVGFGMYVTYHTMIYSIGGNISNSGGGTVNLYAFRESTNEYIMSTSRSGDGAYSFTWFDDVENVYVQAYEDSTHSGRSTNDVAT